MPYYPSGGAAGLPLGLAGATGATRYVGGTATGAPGSGTFSLGDYVIDQTGKVWVCTVAGTPGTWVGVGIAAAGGTPAVVLSTAAAAGVATTFLRDDDTIIAFDVTVPVTQAFSDAAATGSAAVAARRDHKHGMPANPGGVSWPLTNSGDETFQPNGVANNVLDLNNPASAVNGVQITGAITTAAPIVASIGTDTNIGLTISPKGTGTVTITGGATTSPGTALTVAGVNSATSGITITNSGSATGPSLVVAGSATNAGLTIRVKGAGSLLIGDVGTGSIQIGGDSNVGNITIGGNTGNNITIGNPNSTSAVTFQTGTGKLLQLLIGGSTGLTVTGPASSVNGATFTCSASLSAPSLAATGSDTNIDLILNSKGTGVVNLGPASAAAAISGSVGPATLATTTGGATGPGTAAQNQWLKIKVNGTVNYIPTWV